MTNKIYKVLEHNEQRHLSQQFPGLEKLSYHGNRLLIHYGNNKEVLKKYNYKWFYISVFDHWLSYDEAFEELHEHNDITHPKSSLLSAFNLELFQKTKVINFRPVGKRNYQQWYGRKQKISFRKFLSFEKFKSIAGSPQKYLFPTYLYPHLVLPELQALYFPGKDLTHLLIYRNESLLQDFKKWMAEANLYMLFSHSEEEPR